MVSAAEAVASDAEVAEPSEGKRAGRQATWTLLSQGLSSIANFGLTIAVAREVDEVVGGAFTYAFLVFSFALGLMRAIATDPLVIHYSAAGGGEVDRVIRQAAGSSLLLGVGATALCAVGGLVVGGDLGIALALLGIVLPGQFLQDAWRSAAFAAGQPRKAAVSDAVRLVVQFGAIGVITLVGATDLPWYMASWALGAWAAAFLGMWQFATPGLWRQSTGWLRQHAGMSIRLGSDFVLNMGGVTLMTSVLAVILGLAATGGLRFALTLLGPIQVLFGALPAFMIPLMARRLAAQGPRSLRRPAGLVSLGSFLVCATVVTVLLLLPDPAGQELLGQSWENARAVMLPVGVTQGAIALALGGSLPLKALGRADLHLRATMVQAPIMVGLAIAGGAWFDIVAAAWGIATGQVIGCIVFLVLAYRATASKGRSNLVRPGSTTPGPATVRATFGETS